MHEAGAGGSVSKEPHIPGNRGVWVVVPSRQRPAAGRAGRQQQVAVGGAAVAGGGGGEEEKEGR